MKRKNFFVIALLCLCFFINSCGKQHNTFTLDPEQLKPIITQFLESQFIVAPSECIEFIKYDNKENMYEFYVDFNPLELYPDLYDENDDIFVYEKTVFVQEIEDGYVVFDEYNECTRYINGITREE